MIFLALILTLLVAFAWDYGPVLHRDGWFIRWQGQLEGLFPRSVIAVLVAVLLPAVIVQLALNALEPLLFGSAWIAAAVLIFLYSLGRGNFSAKLEKYRSQCRREDFEGAYLYGSEVLHWLTPSDAAEARGPDQVHIAMQKAFLYEAHQRRFAVLFYFLVLGPAGALAYRLLQLCAGQASTRGLMAIVDWVPARLAAAAFTVTGNFVESADELLAGMLEGKMQAPDLLYSVAMAATGEDKHPVPESDFGLYAARQNEMLSGLVRRSSAAWVVVVSLIVLLV